MINKYKFKLLCKKRKSKYKKVEIYKRLRFHNKLPPVCDISGTQTAVNCGSSVGERSY